MDLFGSPSLSQWTCLCGRFYLHGFWLFAINYMDSLGCSPLTTWTSLTVTSIPKET